MTRASRAAAQLPRVKHLAEQHGPALKQAFALLQGGALVGPAGARLQQTLAGAHEDARSGFYAAFDTVHRLAGQDGPPPRIGEPYIPGPPRGGPPGSPGERSGSPAGLDRLGKEVLRAARSWQDAGAALSRILGDLGLSTAPARSVSRAADRVRAQKPDIDRRRDELLKTDQQQVVQAAAKTIEGILPKPKGVKEAVGDLWDIYAHRYLPGVWEGTKDIGLSALAMSPHIAPFYFGINRKSWMERGPVGQVKGLTQGVQNPGEFAKAIINWDEWKRDPVHALGQTVPGIVLAALTMGSGSGAGAASRLGSTIQKAKVERGSGSPGARALERGDNGQGSGRKDGAVKDVPGESAPPHPVLPRRPSSSGSPHPALTSGEKRALDGYIDELKKQFPQKFAESQKDPDHNFKATKGSRDEAGIALDLMRRGVFDESYGRPGGPGQGDFVNKGVRWDIKGIHSDWPPDVPQHIRSRPFPNGYSEAKFRQTMLDQLKKGRNVILDLRNADQGTINDIKRIVDQEGWGDRVIWYP